jgi:hypothetical protein
MPYFWSILQEINENFGLCLVLTSNKFFAGFSIQPTKLYEYFFFSNLLDVCLLV